MKVDVSIIMIQLATSWNHLILVMILKSTEKDTNMVGI